MAKIKPHTEGENLAPQQVSANTTGKRKYTRKPRYVQADYYDEIILWISQGKTLRDYCRKKGKPSRREVDYWRAEDSAFASRFAKARELGFDVIAEECMAIADTPVVGTETEVTSDGKKVKMADMLGHRKLQIETRLKLLAKWDPRRYGEKIAIGGDADAPPINISDRDRQIELQSLMALAASRRDPAIKREDEPDDTEDRS
jgi:hypothetical protein